MGSEEARGRFQKEADVLSVQQLEKLANYMLVEHFDSLVAQFVECFEDYCRQITKMQQASEKGELGYISFSMLRTDILAKDYRLRIDAYDERWYQDRVECVGLYDVSDLCVFLDEFSTMLVEERKKYVYKVSPADVAQIVLKESDRYRNAIMELVRLALVQAVKSPVYKEILRAEHFAITFGEFQDASAIVHKEDRREKDAKEVKKLLEEKRDNGHEYEFFENLDLTNGKYKNIKLAYSSGAGSDFSNSDLTNAVMFFCKFPKATFNSVKLQNSVLMGIDFDGVTMENVDFEDSRLLKLSFKNSTLINIDFTKAKSVADINLENTTLINTTLPTELVVE